MSKGKDKDNGRTYTISVTETLAQWVTELMRKKGYNNASAYFSDLVRRDKDRQDIKEGLYPAHVEQYDQAAEAPSPAVEEDKGRKKAKGR